MMSNARLTLSLTFLPCLRDDGVPYPSHFTMGSIILAQPGQIAELAFQTMDFKAVGSQPTPSFLTDEISGTFTVLPSFVPDPPQLPPSQSLYANRYYFSQTKAPVWCRHMQLKIDYGSTDTVQNELLTLTIFGAHWQER